MRDIAGNLEKIRFSITRLKRAVGETGEHKFSEFLKR